VRWRGNAGRRLGNEQRDQHEFERFQCERFVFRRERKWYFERWLELRLIERHRELVEWRRHELFRW